MNKPSSLIITALAAYIAVMAGCAGNKQVSDDDIAASWGDTLVSVAAFKDRLFIRHRNEPTARKQPMEERLNIFYEYLDRDLKIAEGIRLGFDKREDIRKQYDEAIERKAVDLLYNHKVRDRLFSEQTIRSFWEHDKDEVRGRHILISIPEGVTDGDTMQYWNRVTEIYQKAKAGENFERLVDQYSEDDSIDRQFHGDLGFFRWGKMVDNFQEAAWKLDIGGISPPVRTRYGYHIIQMADRRPRGLEYNTSHILVKVNRRDDPAETTAAFERAKMILEEAKKAGADFAQLARRYSEDDNTWVNGVVGYIPRGSMPSDYWDDVYGMEIGQVIGPVRSYKGFHVIRLNEKRVIQPGLDDTEERERVLSALSRVYRDTLQIVAEVYLDSIKSAMESRYDPEVVKLVMARFGDKSIPSNMSAFSSFSPEERELLFLTDKLGGLKLQELVDRYGDHRFPSEYTDADQMKKELVEPIIMPRYLSGIAREEGYYELPEVLEEGMRALHNAILPEIETEMVFNKAAPTEGEVKKYYEKNIQKYTQAATVTVKEVMVDDAQLAGDIYDRIKKGESIEKLARRYTLREKAKRRGGDLGPFTRDEYGQVSRRAFDLEIGELSEPIKMGQMYSVIQVTANEPERVKTLDEVRRQIESDLRFEKQKEIKDAWVAELRRSYKLKVYEDVVGNVWPLIDQLPEPMVEQRKIWKKEREEIAEQAKRRRAEDKIKLKVTPGKEQQFTTKEGKQVTVKFGEPRYTKGGEEIDPSESNIKLTPKGTLEKTDATKSGEAKTTEKKESGARPVIKLKPKEKDK